MIVIVLYIINVPVQTEEIKLIKRCHKVTAHSLISTTDTQWKHYSDIIGTLTPCRNITYYTQRSQHGLSYTLYTEQ